MQRSIWVSEEEWIAIKEAAYLARKTLSQYLIHLHKMNITSLGLNQLNNEMISITGPDPPPLLVDSEELDKSLDQYPEGTATLIPEDHPSIIKKPVVDSGATRYHNPRPKGQDGIKKKG